MADDIRTTERFGAHWKAFALIVAVSLFVAACQAPSYLQAELPDDGPRVATSLSAAERLVDKLSKAGERAADTGKVEITVTQEEVTSLLSIGSEISELFREYDASSLEELQSIQQSTNAADLADLPEWANLFQGIDGLSGLRLSDLSLRLAISEPEVYFKGNGTGPGHIIVRGYGKLLILKQPLRLVLAPRASDGELVLDFVEGNLGPIGVPEAVIDQIGEWLASVIEAGDDYMVVNKIEVSNGKLTIRGSYQH